MTITATDTLSDAIERGYRIVLAHGMDQIADDFYNEDGCCAVGCGFVGLLNPLGNIPVAVLFTQAESGIHLPDAFNPSVEALGLNDPLELDELPYDYIATLADCTIDNYSTDTLAHSIRLMSVIAGLNDDLGWSINDITSWLRSIGR